MITVLCGGVGAARLLTGLIEIADQADVVAIVNTADDTELHGLHISPDLDTILYTLSGSSNTELGWGLAGETWAAMEALERFAAVRPPGSTAGGTWFRLGDRDLATHLYRTHRRREGASSSVIADEQRRAFGLGLRILPVTDDPLATMLQLADDGTEIAFQDYFVGRHHSVAVTGVRFDGAEAARPAPGVIEAIGDAEVLVIAPSNPIVSIGPLLAVAGVRAAVEARRDRSVAISPIVGGAALKGPADRMLVELGHESSVVGVARLYRNLASTLVIDEVDAALAPAVQEAGMHCVVTRTIMKEPGVAASLCRAALAAVTS